MNGNSGALAQLGAHNTGSVGVTGSNPVCSTSGKGTTETLPLFYFAAPAVIRIKDDPARPRGFAGKRNGFKTSFSPHTTMLFAVSVSFFTLSDVSDSISYVMALRSIDISCGIG